MGGKSRLVNVIVPILNSIALLENIDTYYEPFCGGCAIAEHVNIKHKHCSDSNKGLIELLNLIKSLNTEEQFRDTFKYHTKEDFDYIKHNVSEDTWLYVYNAIFFGYKGVLNRHRNTYFVQWDSYDSVIKILMRESELLKTIEDIHCANFMDLELNNCLIYLDPPYENTHTYTCNKDNLTDFRARDKKIVELAQNNIVLISEYNMDKSLFKEVCSKELQKCILQSSDKAKNSTVVQDKLFVVRGGYKVDEYFGDDVDF
jgi:DNA adenine methylase